MFLDRHSPAYLGGTVRFLLSSLLTEAFQDVAAAVRRGGTVVSDEGTLAPEHPIWVEFARAMMPLMKIPAQALVNLVLNGIQAVDRCGRVAITARCDEARGELAIEVCDTGPGIEPAKRLAIFEPFFTTKPEGSGIGLWIVQQIAMAHGGSIVATHAGGGGALFTLSLPLSPAPPRP